MTQIFDLNARLERIGDYAWFENSRNQRIFAFRFSVTHWGLYSKDYAGFDGSRIPRDSAIIDRFPFLRIFNYTWAVLPVHNLKYGIEEINDETSDDFTIITSNVPLPHSIEDDVFEESEESEEEIDVNVFFSDLYESRVKFTGFHSYHSHHGCDMNKPKGNYRGYRIGIELEVEFYDYNLHQEFINKESNWFYLESDGSLGNFGCEIITIPLRPQEAKSKDFWSTLTDYLKSRAESWNTGRCGLHVHIGREILGKNEEQQSETIGKLLYLYHHFVKDTRLNHKVYGRDRAYNDHDGKTDMGNAAKLLGSDVLKSKSVSDKVKQSMTRKSEEGRYFDINLKNSATIEFRKGRGSINATRIAMVVDYSERMCIYAKNTPWQQISYEDFVSFLRATNKNEDLKNLIDAWS